MLAYICVLDLPISVEIRREVFVKKLQKKQNALQNTRQHLRPASAASNHENATSIYHTDGLTKTFYKKSKLLYHLLPEQVH